MKKPVQIMDSKTAPDMAGLTWHTAALNLGEHLADSGPVGYFSMTPEQWSEWCVAAIERLTRERDEAVVELEEAAFVLDRCRYSEQQAVKRIRAWLAAIEQETP